MPALYPLLSIHAPRAGCDAEKIERKRTKQNFNPRTPCGVRRNLIGDKHFTVRISIHAPRAGCDIALLDGSVSLDTFQSTHPVRGATGSAAAHMPCAYNFNPRTPCGVRRHAYRPRNDDYHISIHAPRAGCDSDDHGNLTKENTFQSTHPVRGATPSRDGKLFTVSISIHAPRAGCDRRGAYLTKQNYHISIHAPRAGCDANVVASFARGFAISIHAPRAGCDRM